VCVCVSRLSRRLCGAGQRTQRLPIACWSVRKRSRRFGGCLRSGEGGSSLAALPRGQVCAFLDSGTYVLPDKPLPYRVQQWVSTHCSVFCRVINATLDTRLSCSRSCAGIGITPAYNKIHTHNVLSLPPSPSLSLSNGAIPLGRVCTPPQEPLSRGDSGLKERRGKKGRDNKERERGVKGYDTHALLYIYKAPRFFTKTLLLTRLILP